MNPAELKKLAAEIYEFSDEIGDRYKASNYRKQAILDVPEEDRFYLRTYIAQIGAGRRNNSGWNLS